MAIARARGRLKGKAPKLSSTQRTVLLKLHGVGEHSIAELAELFKDLSVLVIDQGTLLDSIEYNVEQTAVYMNDAVQDLKVATRYVGSVLRV